ncbi:hypothetical protein COO91_11051 (plasmid) [Nostoc flagelliforme CCNUN1]|uniref:Uncharacterized protein n=1 Tax=Nostoc flagelliforme CCNUN1 TaxID=2038116 RepID=A0A2K8TAT5_9NOSO|nr:hypothetical protein COO91_10486 [Nostoc flagelliforme CCNUN1]AUB44804.1 hypothetical protein COO91_11051 [Nostoc flagelliforme CCNUN1]
MSLKISPVKYAESITLKASFLCPKTALNSKLRTEVTEKIDLGNKRLWQISLEPWVMIP